VYINNSLVTLAANKEHGEGESKMELKAGVCGLVMSSERTAQGGYLYVVDFGPYGQWYCTHEELFGSDSDGWDQESSERRDAGVGTITISIPEIGGPDRNESQEQISPVVDVEADIQKRMAEIEKGI
jgi:hypothetical protein